MAANGAHPPRRGRLLQTPNLIQHLDRNAAFLAAIANKKRLEILCILLQGEQSVGHLADLVHLSQSALSQHLAKLRQQDIVSTRRNGQTIYYTIRCDRTEDLLLLLDEASRAF